MVKFTNWKLFLFAFYVVIVCISASTHWIVTENGRIQSHLNTPFYLRRPYDLVALLDQEVRLSKLATTYKDLYTRKSLIDSKWSHLEGASELETRVYTQDSDCLIAGKLLSEIDLYPSIIADGSDRDGIKISDYLTSKDQRQDVFFEPDCQLVPLDFSMFAFEHLSAMVNRANLSIAPEWALEHWLEPGTTVGMFGHQVATGLLENRTSWMHYNLGAIYWRIKGDAVQAIECGRRAVHFALREYRDIALLNLAYIFHQARHSGEAAIILHAAVDHAPHRPENHFALGNVYAVLTDYNRSIACFDNFLKLRPGLSEAVTIKHATLCYKKLEKGLMDLHESLQGILSEFSEYYSQQEQWIRLHERLMWERAPLEAKLMSYNTEAISKMLENRGQSCMERASTDGKPSMLSCDLNMDSQMMAHYLQIDISLNLQMLLRNVESQAQKIIEQMDKGKPYLNKVETEKKKKETTRKPSYVSELNSLKVDTEEKFPPPIHLPKYPADLTISKNTAPFDSPNWPTKQQCVHWKLPSNYEKDQKFPVFLLPENKGFDVSQMLSDSIGLAEGKEHALPWYPPICQLGKDDGLYETNYFPVSLLRNSLNVHLVFDSYLRQQLLNYVNQGKVTEAEIGQRIITAIQKKTAPGWLLATLASLYWRVRTNTRNTIDCLNLAVQSVPNDYRDVVLVSISSVLYELGYVDDALKVVLEAFSLNQVEPSTNFLLAMIYHVKNNPVIASYHLRQALRVDLNYYNEQADKLLRMWACKVALRVDKNVLKQEQQEQGMCAERDALGGDGVVCSAGGEQCKTAAVHCYRAESIPDESDIHSIAKLFANENCAQKKLGLGHSLITTLLAANNGGNGAGLMEGSGNLEPDQSQLESMNQGHQQAFHMRISLGDDNTPFNPNSLGDFYVSVSLTDDPTPEAMLHVYDKSGTYPLSPKSCRDIKDADWLQFSSMWQSIATRNMDIGELLKPLTSDQEELKPYCDISLPPSPTTLDHLGAMRLRHHKLVPHPEPALMEWLGLMAGDQHASLANLGTRIALALKENATSWILATASALYWRTVGHTDQAVTCLRQALTFAPADVRDIPLISLANVLHRAGFHSDALEVAYIALESRPNFVVNHFTVGNIYTSLGDLETAIRFYRSSLLLDANFEPARNRLQAILCTLLFDESGSLRDSNNIFGN